MVRCDVCRTLNEDNARNCVYCGTSLWMSGRAPSGDISAHRGTITQEERQPGYRPPSPPPANAYAPPAVVQPAANRPHAQGFRCPYCHTNAPPYSVQNISEAGWIVFAMMLLFCFPLFWIGLLMKEDQRFCSACRARLS